LHLDQQGFPDVKIEYLGGDAAARTDPDHPFVKLVCSTASGVYGKPMKLIPLSGGSGPNGRRPRSGPSGGCRCLERRMMQPHRMRISASTCISSMPGIWHVMAELEI
jgi:hypothetical protein